MLHLVSFIKLCFAFLSVFLLTLPCLITSSHNLSLRKQATSLLSLKQNFQGSNTSLHDWNVSNYMCLCTWTGIGCDERRFIVSLDISDLNISGSLSPGITELRALVNLSVAGNKFSGAIPAEIYKLSSLRVLNISRNKFNGSLGWDFSQLQALEVLDAFDNFLSGPLPQNVTAKLKHLDLRGNQFSRSIPSGYGGLGELIYLDLGEIGLRGHIPPELGNLSNLQFLYLDFNQFDGGIPLELGKLVRLVRLDLASCGLKGPVPIEVGNLRMLDSLFLYANKLTGLLTPYLENMTRLQSLDLSENNFIGDIPSELAGLKELTLLCLFGNRLHGEIPRFIEELPKLQVLFLWNNSFTGSIPSNLGLNSMLVELDLSINELIGSVPQCLCSGRRLKTLILFDNFLFGPLPDDLGHCETLSRVRLGQNYLNGSIPKGFLYLRALSFVELQDNMLSRQLEESKSRSSSQLEWLDLSNNHLSGSLPTSIGKFSRLQTLQLGGNQFTGDIPPEIGRLQSITRLDMRRNKLSGVIPTEIGDCSSLVFLDLSQNQLSGPIPSHIAEIQTLHYLNVSWNHLNQSLPEEIGSMNSLASADFSCNNFTGSIPQTGQFLSFNSKSFIGNPNLCGSDLNKCNRSPTLIFKPHGENHSQFKVQGTYILILALGFVFICTLIFAVIVIIKRRVRKHSNPWKLTAFEKLGFGIEDILECLKDENIIGRGGAGIVHKGRMPNGVEVAVKKLGIGRGSRDNGFSAEIQTLGKIRHRYIVRLLAFCSNKENNLLVYEYMPNGSLGGALHGRDAVHLTWDTRLKIAIEAAKGLSYLHHDCSPLIIHRDVKSNNILLSSDCEAHVADFGLAKFFQGHGTSEYMSTIAGTFGYIAPEYAHTLKVNEKIDVYSFGVVLLELITGRKPLEDFGEEGMEIVQWTRSQTDSIKEGVVKILDGRLENVPLHEAMQVFFVALLCVRRDNVERPNMREVVQLLAQAKQP